MVAQHGVRRLLLVAERQEWCFLVCTSGLPSYPVLRAAAGADCAWPPIRHGGFWKHFLFYVLLSRFSHLEIWTLPLPALMVEQLVDVLQLFDALMTVPEQVIEVPKIISEDVPMRAVLRATQLAEQLVEAPTIISYLMIALLHARLAQRTVEQNVDIPAVGVGGTGGGLPGFLPGQNYSMTAEQIVDNPVPSRGFDEGLQGFPPGQSTAASSEQIVDIPVPHGGRHDLSPSSADFSNPPDTANQGVFRTFPRLKKKCEGHFALESESASERQLIRAERSSNGSCRSPSGLLR